MSQSIFTELLNETKSQMSIKQRDAVDWLRTKAGRTNVNPATVIKQGEKTYSNIRNGIGQMFLFGYKPKTANDLKYYDVFPLVFPFKMMPDGFYGINFHYLPYILRARLLDSISNLTNNNKMDETTRLKISYDILNASARYSLFKPCVKRYLLNHVTSKFMYIPPTEWKIALFVPLERFVKASKTTVWADSVKQIGRT